MDKLLRPERFDADQNSPKAAQEWTHWKATFNNFITSVDKLEDDGKLKLLVNYVSHNNYEHISCCSSYSEAIKILDSIFIKPKNEIFARHCLTSRKQQPGETVDQYLQALKHLSKDCNFKTVSAEENQNDYIRDSFISGLSSSQIRQRLLENTTLKLDEAKNQALSLESAQKHSEAYSFSQGVINSIQSESKETHEDLISAATKVYKCYFCGSTKRHFRTLCPARDSTCTECGKRGHFSKVCLNKRKVKASASIIPASGLLCAAPESLTKCLIKIKLNNVVADALVDTGSSETYINEHFASIINVPIHSSTGYISMASTALQSQISGHCFVDLEMMEHKYRKLRLSVLSDLCADVIIGHDILRQHSTLEVSFGGSKSSLCIDNSPSICSLAFLKIDPPTIFSNLSADCRPIATKSRRFSPEDRHFISTEIKNLLSNNIIEESNSPWRAQVLVTKNETHKKRMVVDYSQTINRFTYLDAYPLPNIEDIVRAVAKFEMFSTIDLQSAYHQVPIRDDEKQYTAFEADGKLYQFRRIPFGVTNGVACFQRVIDYIIKSENLEGVYAYLDDITICGRNQADHDKNLKKFLLVVRKYNFTINEKKSSYSLKSIKLLGYLIENNALKPDPIRLEPLRKLPVPADSQSLKRAIGMFAHYSKWIPCFSEKIHRLVSCKSFPLSEICVNDFEKLKLDIAKSAVTSIKDNIPFVVETDASEHSIAATLSQAGRPVAFFSRTLSKCEQNHSSVEKEAYSIVEAIKKWRHFLIGRHFQLITDQKSVSFMFDTKHSSKIKNEKILRWRLELSCYSYDIIYRPGRENIVADTFSRVCGANSQKTLFDLHQALCHPGITRMVHWVRSRNMPYSVEDIRIMSASCPVCAELKPKFIKYQGTLIKATSVFERISLDFKGPLPSDSRNKYILTIVDEYSRFPFAYPCQDMTSETVIRCLSNLFSIFGMPGYIHTDQGSSFMSNEFKNYLHSKGIATSRSTPYNPEGNGQTERFNGIIWKTINLALRSRNLKIQHWEAVLEDALHSIRSLLCTATNSTPHERMFRHSRKSMNGTAIPSWLTSGKIYMKKHVRHSKYDPLVEEVDLIEANPQYALVRLSNGREATVSLKHLAPCGDDSLLQSENNADNHVINTPTQSEDSEDLLQGPILTEQLRDIEQENDSETINQSLAQPQSIHCEPQLENQMRRGSRTRQSPKYLDDYVEK